MVFAQGRSGHRAAEAGIALSGTDMGPGARVEAGTPANGRPAPAAAPLAYQVGHAYNLVMTTRATTVVTVSSKGQVVLPAPVRRRLGLGPGAHLELIEEAGGVKLKVQRPLPVTQVTEVAGMVTARSKGKPRSLFAFDPAQMLKGQRR